MKIKEILKGSKETQIHYLPYFKAQIPPLYADLKVFQNQLLDAFKAYGDALKDSHNPLWIKTFGIDVLTHDVISANNQMELLQAYISDTLRYIETYEFAVKTIEDNLKKS